MTNLINAELNVHSLVLFNVLYHFIVLSASDVLDVECHDLDGNVVWVKKVWRWEGRQMYSALLKLGAEVYVEPSAQCPDCGQWGHTGCMDDVVEPQ